VLEDFAKQNPNGPKKMVPNKSPLERGLILHPTFLADGKNQGVCFLTRTNYSAIRQESMGVFPDPNKPFYFFRIKP
jgi:hypothetical protein